jgi:LysM repeat protein
MLGRPVPRRLTFLCAALAGLLAATRAPAQSELADLHEDVRGLTQRVGELSLRVEELEHENAQLRSKVAGLDGGKDSVTTVQLNSAVAQLNASIKSAVESSRGEILKQVAAQMENLARQTNAALDSVAKGNSAPVRAAAPAAKAAPSEATSREGVSYTVQKGDSLGIIAKKTGAKAQDIIDANKLADPSRIQVGQVLFVPGGR